MAVKMKIEIKKYADNSVLFSHDAEENTLKISLLAALKAGANLFGADLEGADLRGANLFRANLEETGMGYGLEVDLIQKARALDLLTTPYVFNAEQAADMARAGADIVVCHMGLTTGGNIGASTALTLSDCVAPIREWCAAAMRVNPEVLLLCHGGPIATPADATWMLAQCPELHGFYGASSMERLPTEIALTQTTREFMQIKKAT